MPPQWTQRTDSFPRLAADLQMLHSGLQLRFNFMRARYEVWGPRGLVLRISDEHDDFAPPGPWVVEVVRGNPTYRPKPDAIRRAEEMEQDALRQEELAKRARDAVQNAQAMLAREVR